MAPWGLIFNRQYVYDLGGGPVWSVRSPQYATLSREHRPWTVRLDTTPGKESDWLFEREWRIPLSTSAPALPVTTTNLVGVLIGDPNWRPSERLGDTGFFISGATGEQVHPHEPHAQPDVRPGLPSLWLGTDLRVYWGPTTQRFGSAMDAAAGDNHNPAGRLGAGVWAGYSDEDRCSRPRTTRPSSAALPCSRHTILYCGGGEF